MGYVNAQLKTLCFASLENYDAYIPMTSLAQRRAKIKDQTDPALDPRVDLCFSRQIPDPCP